MKLRVLALDYDGTIAQDGRLDPEVRTALAEARARGLVVVLATGRILSDLQVLIGDLEIFDAIVAENGAVTAYPRSGRSSVCAPRSSRALMDELSRRGIEARAGRCVVELDASWAHAVLDVVRELELPLVLHFNRGRLMVLPQAVSKATGLREALRTLRLSVHNAIGVGDAENDHELLAACEIGAAVAWGSPQLRAHADVVVPGDGPRAVAEYVRSVVANPRILPPRAPRRQLVLGTQSDGATISLAVGGQNVLVAGDPRSGKSWITGLLCEQLVLQGYCVCVLDPEGDYEPLEALPGVVLLGGDAPPPSMRQLARSLRHADVSVVVDLARLEPQAKRLYVLRALSMLAELRRETGLPHRIVVDEAHYFLHDPEEMLVLDPELEGYTLVTYRLSSLHRDALLSSELAIVTRETDPEEVRLLHETWQSTEDFDAWRTTLQSLRVDEAVLLPRDAEHRGRLQRFRLARRLTPHVRHRHKYADVPVSDEAAFQVVFEDGSRGPLVRSLHELVTTLTTTALERLEPHVLRGDFSRWIEVIFRDLELAEEVRALEERHRLGDLQDFAGAVIHAVRERYRMPLDPLPETAASLPSTVIDPGPRPGRAAVGGADVLEAGFRARRRPGTLPGS